MKRLMWLLLLPLFVACEKQGPLEEFGERIDDTVDDVRNGAETAADKIGDAADDLRDGIEDAVDEVE